MANFQTHFSGAAIAGVLSSSLFLSADVVPIHYFLSCLCLTIIGGIFPDIDSDHSESIKIIFTLLGLFFSTFSLIFVTNHASLLICIISFFTTYLVIRYGLINAFRHLTSHRGLFHSIPMSLLISILIYMLSHWGLKFSTLSSLVFGFSFLIGYITHLGLDEFYSVNFSNVKLKKSFGSALTIFSLNNVIGYSLLYIILFSLIFINPIIISNAILIKNLILKMHIL